MILGIAVPSIESYVISPCNFEYIKKPLYNICGTFIACMLCWSIQYETNCPLLVATPERGILMPGEQIGISLLLDG